MECQVCYETATEDEYKKLECSHSLCKFCLSKLRQHKCPFCRAPIILPNKEQLLPVLNDDEGFNFNDDNNLEVIEIDMYNYDFSLDINNYNQRVRHRRRRRNRCPNRERTVNADISRIPTNISEEEISEILNNDIFQVNNSEISKSTSDDIKQHARFKRNRWKYCNTNISSKYVRR